MAKCLRCRAGNEWIQGRVRDEPEELLAEVERLRTENAAMLSELTKYRTKLSDFVRRQAAAAAGGEE